MQVLDLFFQIWLAEVNPPKGYSQSLLWRAYQDGETAEEFYYKYVYLPF